MRETEMRATEIHRVTYRWDDQSGAEPGWYCQTFSGGELVDDSQKIWFPVGVDQFAEDELDDLVAALRGHFPIAEVTHK